MFRTVIERLLFASRWLLVPFYLALTLSLFFLLYKGGQEMVHYIVALPQMTETDVILAVLSLIDLTFTGSLVVIVIFSGYENFVAPIKSGDAVDWPEWMSKIDFTGLKLKLLSSIVVLSGIQLLKAMLNLKALSDRELIWYVSVHLVFVGSGLLLAWTDKLSAETKSDH
jgi:uncharacterized protein (TIGR00645 family)